MRQIQQSGQQRVGPESSADHLCTPGHFWTRIDSDRCLVRCSAARVATVRRANRKQGQPVVMSKFKLMESFISYTSVCPIFRRAKCYHAFGTAQSYPCQVSKTLADRCFNHENRYVSSFQLLLHCLHVLNNPQSSTHEALDSLTMSHLFKAHSIHQNHTWNHIKIVFLRPRISLLLKRPLNNKCPCCDAAA